jgi:methyl-accepting chemotaxis protein
MNALSISNRIVAGFAALMLILIALGVYAIAQVGEVRATVDRIVERDVAAMQKLTTIEQALGRMVEQRTAALRRFILAEADTATPIAQWTDAVQSAQDGVRELSAQVEDFRQSAANAGRREDWQRMAAQLDAADAAIAQTRSDVEAQFAALRANDRAAVLAREPAIVQDRARMLAQVSAVRGTLADTIESGRVAVSAIYDRSRLSIALAVALATLVGIVIAFTIRRSIVGPLETFMGFVDHVGRGDLTGSVAATGRDEFGRLGGNLNLMVEGLRAIAAQSREATENLNAAATEIRASTQQQAASVEEQLAAVQETAATVDEITHSGSQISRRAQEVIAAAQASARTTDAGVAAVEDTVHAMDAIREQAEAVAGNIVALSEKTQAIGDIIQTVNDVSERSHLLALNASIEAAAAGESGRSFAIVASELKTLADQAKDATKNVRTILSEIQRGINASVMLTEEAVKRAAAGKQRTDQSQAAIDEMGARIQESVQTFQQIVASTNQQQIGIEQVTIALQNIRQASQQTAASTRQLDQAAGDLTNLSRTLVGLTERYRV